MKFCEGGTSCCCDVLYRFLLVCACACVCVWSDKRLKVREFKSHILKTSVFQTERAQQDNCFLSKRQTQTMHLEFLIITFWEEKKIWMNPYE